MEEKGMALVILGIVAILALIGLVMMFKGSTGAAARGTCWYAGGHMQCEPDAACKRMYGDMCEKAEIEKGAAPYQAVGGVNKVLCKCKTGYTAPNDYEYKYAPILQLV